MVEESKKITPEELEQYAKNSKRNFDGNLKKADIICSAWLLGKNGARDKLVGSQKRKIGKVDFVIKGKRYYIDYDHLKEGKKCYYYDTDVTNAIGALSNHDVSDKVNTQDGKVKPNNADMMLIDGVVKVLMGKGGIPAMYLLVAFIVVGIALAGMMYFLSQYQTQTKQIENLNAQNLVLKNDNIRLQQELDAINGIITEVP